MKTAVFSALTVAALLLAGCFGGSSGTATPAEPAEPTEPPGSAKTKGFALAILSENNGDIVKSSGASLTDEKVGLYLVGYPDAQGKPVLAGGRSFLALIPSPASNPFVTATNAPGLGAGWNGYEMIRKLADGSTQRIIWYNNRARPAPAGAFKDVFTEDGFDSAENMVKSTDARSGSRGFRKYRTSFSELAVSPSFPTAAGTKTFTKGGAAFAGTFAGVAGKFACTAAEDCTVTRNADGSILIPESGTAVLTFTADDPDARVTMPDGVYTVMGYWLQEPSDADGTYYYGIRPFPNSTKPVGNVAGTAGITGTAVYTGSATGAYAARGAAAETRGGLFTATATINADFSADKLRGSVKDFKDSGGQTLPGWSIQFTEQDIENEGAYSGHEPTTNSLNRGSTYFRDTSGYLSGKGADGQAWRRRVWSATFGEGQETGTNHPNTVAGQFGATTLEDNRELPDTGAFTSVRGIYHAGKQ